MYKNFPQSIKPDPNILISPLRKTLSFFLKPKTAGKIFGKMSLLYLACIKINVYKNKYIDLFNPTASLLKI